MATATPIEPITIPTFRSAAYVDAIVEMSCIERHSSRFLLSNVGNRAYERQSGTISQFE